MSVLISRKKTLATLVITAIILVLGLATTALGMIQSKPFDSSTTPQEVVDTYKSGLPFKQYISLTIKNQMPTAKFLRGTEAQGLDSYHIP